MVEHSEQDTMSPLERARLEMKSFDYIRFALCDLKGRSVGQVIPTRNVTRYLEDGLSVYEGLLVSFLEQRPPVKNPKGLIRSSIAGNMLLLPDLATLRPLPWATVNNLKVAELTCESFWKLGAEREPQAACPRYVLKQQLDKLSDMGFDIFSGFEIEYLAFDGDQMEPVTDDELVYLSHREHNKNGKMLLLFDSLLQSAGVNVDRFHAEDTEGMFEVVLKPSYGIAAADSAFNCKQGLLEVGDLNNIKVTFMSMPGKNWIGTGCHLNFSVFSKATGRNVFYDKSTADNLSQLAKQWIAGVLKHIKVLTALQCPTVNCYRRLHRVWTPGEIFWDIDNRDACIRVKNDGPTGTYIEIRLPSGKSNPYIVMASTIAAGLHGVTHKLKCPAAGVKLGKLPGSLKEAVKHLEQDACLRELLAEEFITWVIATLHDDLKLFKDVTNDRERKALERKNYL